MTFQNLLLCNSCWSPSLPALQTLCFFLVLQRLPARYYDFSNEFSKFYLNRCLSFCTVAPALRFFGYFAHMAIMLAQNCLGFPTIFDTFTFYLSSFLKNDAPTNGFSNIFDLASNLITSCNPSTLTKSYQLSFFHIFPLNFQGFHVNASRLHSGEVRNLQRSCRNMLRSMAVMSPKSHCA